MGHTAHDRRDYEEAVADFTQELDLFPSDADGHYARGLAREDLGDTRGAIADETQAYRLYVDQRDEVDAAKAQAVLRRLTKGSHR